MNDDNLEKLFSENKRLRGNISKIKNFITCGILVLVIVFLVLMWNLFRNFDREEFIGALTSEVKILTPTVSNYAVEIFQEVVPVYQDAFRKEFETLSPQIKKEVDKEMLLFSKYVSEEIPELLRHELELVFGRARVRIMSEFPELFEDEDKLVKAFMNLAISFGEGAEELATTGIFSHQAELLRDIYDTIHEGFPMRKSDETRQELADRLFNLLGRIIEYEFFVERIEKETPVVESAAGKIPTKERRLRRRERKGR